MAPLAEGWRRLRALDRASLAAVLIFLGLLTLDRSQALESAVFVVRAAASVLPYLLLSVATAAGVVAAGADGLIARAFQGRPARMIVLAALSGALSPFCSCGVIPVVAALLAMGVPLAPVMAFWLASPLMDPAMFFMTAGTLGTGFAVAKTGAAVMVGLLGGFGTWALSAARLVGPALRPQLLAGASSERFRNPRALVWRFWTEPPRSRAFRAEFVAKSLFLGKWLVLAFLLESLMLAWVPADAVLALVGGSGWATIALAATAGAPAYLNGYAALPLTAGLMQQGMSPGAAMAFLVSGGITSIPAMIAVWATARVPVFVLYLGFAVAGAMLAGALAATLL